MEKTNNITGRFINSIGILWERIESLKKIIPVADDMGKRVMGREIQEHIKAIEILKAVSDK